MPELRTKETSKKYQDFKDEGRLEGGCALCKKISTKEFTHWKIVPNDFPYDAVAKEHHMIVSKRCVDEKGLNEEEKEELLKIKENYLNTKYEYIIEATGQTKSIPKHFHLHLINAKENI